MKNWSNKYPLNALQTFQLMRFATTLLIGILLARFFQLSTPEIALYEVLLFLGNFLSFFWISAGIKSLLSQFSKEKEAHSLLINLAFLLFILGVSAGGLLYFFQDFIIHQFTQYEELAHIGLISLFLVFNAPTAIIEYIYLLQKKEKAILWYGALIFSSQLLVIIIPLVFNWGLSGIFQGLLLWSILKFIWLLNVLFSPKRNAANTKVSLNWLQLKNLLLLMLPLSLHMLIGGGMEYVDGFIVTSHFEDTGMFAVFRYGARELPLVTILTAALTATLIPLAVENQPLAITKIKAEVHKLSRWLFPVTVLLILLSPYLFPLVYTDKFAESAQVFNVYLLIISSRLLLPQVIIYAQQHNFVLVWSAIIEVLINVGLSLYLVEIHGLVGIAFATVIAYLVNKIILIAYVHFTFKIPLTDYLPLKSYIFYNVFLIVGFLIAR
ncbi:MAG: hypothetical protein AB8G86_05250 [Saprospiraceae bacterium]